MKSQFESADHTRIHTVKEELHKEALEYLKSGVIGRRLSEIIYQNAENARIQAVKIALDEQDRCPIKKAKQAPKFTKNSVGTPADAIDRLITGELSGSDRYMIRNIALDDARSQKRGLILRNRIQNLLKRVKKAKKLVKGE